jgi:hypothetical protein
MSREQLVAAIMAERPSGYFAEVMPLLRRYADLFAASHDVNRRLRHIPLDSPQAGPVLREIRDLTEEMIDIAEALHLCPGDRDLGFPPPRMQ